MGITLKMKRLACEALPIGDHQNACRVTRSRKHDANELALFFFLFFSNLENNFLYGRMYCEENETAGRWMSNEANCWGLLLGVILGGFGGVGGFGGWGWWGGGSLSVPVPFALCAARIARKSMRMSNGEEGRHRGGCSGVFMMLHASEISAVAAKNINIITRFWGSRETSSFEHHTTSMT